MDKPTCAYCGLEESEGAVISGPKGLCQYCIKDPVLGRCGHSAVCDCEDGLCA